MSDTTIRQPGRRPPYEVRVYQYGLLKTCAWCTSEADAAGICAMWQSVGGVRCEIVS